jgi:hypothetical protein
MTSAASGWWISNSRMLSSSPKSLKVGQRGKQCTGHERTCAQCATHRLSIRALRLCGYSCGLVERRCSPPRIAGIQGGMKERSTLVAVLLFILLGLAAAVRDDALREFLDGLDVD